MFQKLNKWAIGLYAMLAANSAAASGSGSDPFGELENKATSLADIFTGGLATAIGTLVIIVVGTLYAVGKMSAFMAVRIGIGGVLIASAETIMSWLV